MEMPFFYSGVNTTPENERVKALSEACLDRSYSRFNKIKNCSDKALSGTCLDSLYFGADLSGNRPSQLRRLGGSSLHFALLRSGTAAQAVQHGPGLSAFFSGQSASHKKGRAVPKV